MKLHRSGQSLCPFEQRPDQLRGQVGERLVVPLRHEEDVAREERPDVEERHGQRIVEHDVSWDLAADDGAEHAGGHGETVPRALVIKVS